jgi:Domain of Unknown Function (DUF349)
MENENEYTEEMAHDDGQGQDVLTNAQRQGEVVAPLTEEKINGKHKEATVVDYSTFTKVQFATLLKDLAKDGEVRTADSILREVKPFLDDIRERERIDALKIFISDGGTKEDFSFKSDAYDMLIDGSIKLIRDRKVKFQREAEAVRNENLAKKRDVLNRIRELVDAEDNESSFHQFKKLQAEWKNIGQVPPSELKTLWANYHALEDRFYDHRNIYFELKELDRKRNLEAKLELCVRAEKLKDLKSISEAVRELNELHNDFKHIGPVPLEEKENLWKRFKAASDTVYARRDSHVKEVNEKLNANLEVKQKLMSDILDLATFSSDKIKDWNAKTLEVLALQKQWESSGPVARNKSKDTNKKFWTAFKTFFHNKSIFFKRLDDERQENLSKKKALIQQAIDLKQSEDWEKTANQIKDLQRMWKDIGPVPDKLREKVYQEFKEACDYFFGQKRNSLDKADREQEDNLIRKNQICAAIETMSAEKTCDPTALKTLVAEFNEIGFVPKRAINIRERLSKLVHDCIYGSTLSTDEKERLQVEISLINLKNDPEASNKIFHKEQILKKKISKAENDIAVLRNNLEFFGRSKNAVKYKEEFNSKISEAEGDLKQLKAQLKMLRSVS